MKRGKAVKPVKMWATVNERQRITAVYDERHLASCNCMVFERVIAVLVSPLPPKRARKVK